MTSNTNLSDPITNEPYDLTTHIPYLLLCCGETSSIVTIQNWKSSGNHLCPLCKASLPDGGWIINKIVCNLLKAQDTPTDQAKIEALSKRRICHEHPQREATFLCFEDDVIACFQCLQESNDHQGHKVEELEPALQDMKTKLKESNSKIEMIEEKSDELLAKMFKNFRDIVQQKLKAKSHETDLLLSEINRFQTSNRHECPFSVKSLLEFYEEVNEDKILSKLDVYQKQVLMKLDKLIFFPTKIQYVLQENKLNPEGRQLIERQEKPSTELKLKNLEETALRSISNDSDPNLVSVLNFTMDRIDSAKMANLCIGLKDLKSVSTLHLDLTGLKNLCDKDIENFNSILKDLKSLLELHLIFRKCNQVSQVGLKSLGASLKELKSLSSLDLKFDKCAQVGNEEVEGLIIGLKELVFLKSFHFALKSSRPLEKGITCLSLGLRELVNLTTLELDLDTIFIREPDSQVPSSNEFEDLNMALKALQSLSTLRLSFDNCCEIEDRGIESLSLALQKLGLLSTLDLNFNGGSYPNKISDEGMKSLSMGLKELKSLSTLHLGLYACENITDDGIESLSLALKELNKLSTLTLDFKGCKNIKSKGVQSLCTELQELRLLKNLGLDLRDCEIEDIDSIACQAQLLRKLKSLSTLSLKLFSYGNYVNVEERVEMICKGLKKLRLLSALTLDFSHVNDRGLESLGLVLMKLDLLTTLVLNFRDYHFCQISDIDIKYFSMGLKKLKSLVHVQLNFPSTEISETGLESLSTSLKKLKSLSTLTLNFVWCSKITDGGLEKLSQAFKTFEFLSKLDLCLNHCSLLTDVGMELLCKGLNSLKSLSTLRLDFFKCELLTNRGLQKIGLALEGSKMLDTLYLDFGFCPLITNVGIENLGMAIKELKLLNSLTLCFDQLFDITDDSMESLGACLKETKLLSSFTLSLGESSNVTEKGIDKLSMHLKDLPFLSHLSVDIDKNSQAMKNLLEELKM